MGSSAISTGDLKTGKVTWVVEGTSAMESIMELLPKFQSDKSMPNVKLVCATSYELFQLQSKEYRDQILHKSEWLDSTVISNGFEMGMHPWLASKISEGYAMTAETWGNRSLGPVRFRSRPVLYLSTTLPRPLRWAHRFI